MTPTTGNSEREELRQSIEAELELSVSRDDCWLFARSKNELGYGRIGKTSAHRFVYEALVGPIPRGLVIDHLCRVPACINPDHLEPVTSRENTQRGIVAEYHRRRLMSITHCKHGHKFTGKNTFITCSRIGGVARKCRACRNTRAKQRSVKRAARENRPVGAVNELKTHCPQGHLYTPENTYINKYKYSGSRACRSCKRIWDARRYYKLKAAHQAGEGKSE